MKLTLAPGKIAVKKIEAKLKGGIELPVSRAKAYDIAEITHVGRLDSYGHEGKESTVENFKPGDIVLFQLPIHIASMASHTVKNVLTLFLNVPDIIAKLDNSVIEMKSFHIAGRYLLLKPQIRRASGLIIVPDTAEEMNKESLHFSVLQMGADVKIDVFAGQEVFPHRARINPIVVDGEEVCFVDQQFIDGAMVEG
jgi:co-chaperonin GroES (HSP10)